MTGMRSAKFLFALVAFALLAGSCRKSYTCSCYELYEYNKYEIKAKTQDEAVDACRSYDEPAWRSCTLTEGYFEKKKKK